MLKLYFLRHGQTELNVKERVQGWNDSPLTELGVYQAKCTGYGLRNHIFTAAYCGDTGRQIATAETFMSQNLNPINIIPDYHFREMCYGKYQEGTYYDMLNQLFERVNDVYGGYEGLYRHYTDMEIGQLLCESDETGAFEGPERTWSRVKEGIDFLKDKYPEGDILISTSSFAISDTVHHLFPGRIGKGLVENASITVIGIDNNEFSLLEYNNISYRKEGEEHFKQ